jgi:ribosomal protein S6--L-glutamate ligase
VQRALGPAQLSTLLPLERAGVRCCNRIDATIAVRDRHRTFQALANNAIPVPQTAFVTSWHDVLREAKGRRVVVKCAAEVTGRGGAVLKAPDGTLPPHEPFAGPYLLQEYIAGDARDYKVYVAGDQARGLIKSYSSELQVEQFEVDRELTALARRVGSRLRLEIYGVDVLYGPAGPVVVDVNPFPGFRGIPDAAELAATYLLAL